MKPVYNMMIYPGPNGEPPHVFRDQFNAAHGTTNPYWAFHNNLFPLTEDQKGYDASGWIDERKFEAFLDTIPYGERLFLNVEGTSPFWTSYLPQGADVNEVGLTNKVKLLRWCRVIRPDLKYGLFLLPPCQPLVGVSGPDHELWRNWLTKFLPLAEAVDFYLPYCYEPKDWPLGRTTLQIQRLCLGIRDRLPWKDIIFILFAGQFWQSGTDERTEIPGPYWRATLETALVMADAVMMFEGGRSTFPYPGESDWFKETIDFLETRHM